MSESAPLYNSRLNKIYVQYLREYYPDIDVDSILEEAGIAGARRARLEVLDRLVAALQVVEALYRCHAPSVPMPTRTQWKE